MPTEIKLYRSEVVSDEDTNGGYENCATEIISGILFNLFPRVMPEEAQSGFTRYRKFFVHVVGQTTSITDFVIYRRSTGGDYFRVCVGTPGQTQGGLLSSSPKWYGTGVLADPAPAGSTQITVVFDGECPDLEVGDKLLLTEKSHPADSGDEEFAVIDSVSISGVTATITLTNGLTSSYDAGSSVCHVLELGAIEPSWSDWTENSTSGTYDESNYPPEVYTWGTIEEEWTIEFTSATGFSCSGARVGSVGTGTIGEDFSPVNPVGGTYFTIKASGWGGTWNAGDTVTFKTHPSSKPLWMKEVVPPNCPPTSVNSVWIAIYYTY